MFKVNGTLEVVKLAKTSEDIKGFEVQAQKFQPGFKLEAGEENVKCGFCGKEHPTKLYFWSKFLGYDFPNGNGDAIPRRYAADFGPSFISRHLDVNHVTDPQNIIGRIESTWHVEVPLVDQSGPDGKIVGSVTKMYNFENEITGELQVEGVCMIDRTTQLGDDIAHKLISGVLKSVSQEASTEYCQCSVCGHKMTNPYEPICAHVQPGSLMLKSYEVEDPTIMSAAKQELATALLAGDSAAQAAANEKMAKARRNILAYKIHHNPVGTGLAVVTVPAYDKAQVRELIAEMKSGKKPVQEVAREISQQEAVHGQTPSLLEAAQELNTFMGFRMNAQAESALRKLNGVEALQIMSAFKDVMGGGSVTSFPPADAPKMDKPLVAPKKNPEAIDNAMTSLESLVRVATDDKVLAWKKANAAFKLVGELNVLKSDVAAHFGVGGGLLLAAGAGRGHSSFAGGARAAGDLSRISEVLGGLVSADCEALELEASAILAETSSEEMQEVGKTFNASLKSYMADANGITAEVLAGALKNLERVLRADRIQHDLFEHIVGRYGRSYGEAWVTPEIFLVASIEEEIQKMSAERDELFKAWKEAKQAWEQAGRPKDASQESMMTLWQRANDAYEKVTELEKKQKASMPGDKPKAVGEVVPFMDAAKKNLMALPVPEAGIKADFMQRDRTPQADALPEGEYGKWVCDTCSGRGRTEEPGKCPSCGGTGVKKGAPDYREKVEADMKPFQMFVASFPLQAAFEVGVEIDGKPAILTDRGKLAVPFLQEDADSEYFVFHNGQREDGPFKSFEEAVEVRNKKQVEENHKALNTMYPASKFTAMPIEDIHEDKSPEEITKLIKEWEVKMKHAKGEEKGKLAQDITKAKELLKKKSAKVSAMFMPTADRRNGYWAIEADGKIVYRVKVADICGKRFNAKVDIAGTKVSLLDHVTSDAYGQDIVAHAKAEGVEEVIRQYDLAIQAIKAGAQYPKRLANGKWRDSNGNSYESLHEAAEAEAHNYMDPYTEPDSPSYHTEHQGHMKSLEQEATARYHQAANEAEGLGEYPKQLASGRWRDSNGNSYRTRREASRAERALNAYKSSLLISLVPSGVAGKLIQGLREDETTDFLLNASKTGVIAQQRSRGGVLMSQTMVPMEAVKKSGKISELTSAIEAKTTVKAANEDPQTTELREAPKSTDAEPDIKENKQALDAMPLATELEDMLQGSDVEHYGEWRYTDKNDAAIFHVMTPENGIPVRILVAVFEDGSVTLRAFQGGAAQGSDAHGTSEMDAYEGVLSMNFDDASDQAKREMVEEVEYWLGTIDKMAESWGEGGEMEASANPNAFRHIKMSAKPRALKGKEDVTDALLASLEANLEKISVFPAGYEGIVDIPEAWRMVYAGIYPKNFKADDERPTRMMACLEFSELLNPVVLNELSLAAKSVEGFDQIKAQLEKAGHPQARDIARFLELSGVVFGKHYEGKLELSAMIKPLLPKLQANEKDVLPLEEPEKPMGAEDKPEAKSPQVVADFKSPEAERFYYQQLGKIMDSGASKEEVAEKTAELKKECELFHEPDPVVEQEESPVMGVHGFIRNRTTGELRALDVVEGVKLHDPANWMLLDAEFKPTAGNDCTVEQLVENGPWYVMQGGPQGVVVFGPSEDKAAAEATCQAMMEFSHGTVGENKPLDAALVISAAQQVERIIKDDLFQNTEDAALRAGLLDKDIIDDTTTARLVRDFEIYASKWPVKEAEVMNCMKAIANSPAYGGTAPVLGEVEMRLRALETALDRMNIEAWSGEDEVDLGEEPKFQVGDLVKNKIGQRGKVVEPEIGGKVGVEFTTEAGSDDVIEMVEVSDLTQIDTLHAAKSPEFYGKVSKHYANQEDGQDVLHEQWGKSADRYMEKYANIEERIIGKDEWDRRDIEEHWDAIKSEVDKTFPPEMAAPLYLLFEDENYHSLNEMLDQLGRWEVPYEIEDAEVKPEGEEPMGLATVSSLRAGRGFDQWIDTFISEKGIDPEEMFEFEGASGHNDMPYGVVIEHMKIASPEEQAAVKNMIIKLDFKNADIKDYLRHLGKALDRGPEDDGPGGGVNAYKTGNIKDVMNYSYIYNVMHNIESVEAAEEVLQDAGIDYDHTQTDENGFLTFYNGKDTVATYSEHTKKLGVIDAPTKESSLELAKKGELPKEDTLPEAVVAFFQAPGNIIMAGDKTSSGKPRPANLYYREPNISATIDVSGDTTDFLQDFQASMTRLMADFGNLLDADERELLTEHMGIVDAELKRRAAVKASQEPIIKPPKKKPEEYDQEQLDKGMKVEMEHTSDKALATNIACNHLDENPEYYKDFSEKDTGKEELIKASHSATGARKMP